MKKYYAYGVLIIAAVFIILYCSGTFKEEVTTSGIYGEVTIGPITPVVRAGDESKNEKPYQATIIVKNQAGSKEIKRFQSDANGNFKVYLSPGTYLLEPLSKNSMPPVGRPETVTVKPDEFTEVNITYDSGIR